MLTPFWGCTPLYARGAIGTFRNTVSSEGNRNPSFYNLKIFEEMCHNLMIQVTKRVKGNQ